MQFFLTPLQWGGLKRNIWMLTEEMSCLANTSGPPPCQLAPWHKLQIWNCPRCLKMGHFWKHAVEKIASDGQLTGTAAPNLPLLGPAQVLQWSSTYVAMINKIRPRLFDLSVLGHRSVCLNNIHWNKWFHFFLRLTLLFRTTVQAVLHKQKKKHRRKKWSSGWIKLYFSWKCTLFLSSTSCLGKYFSFGQCNHLFPFLISLPTNLCFLRAASTVHLFQINSQL